MFVSLFVCLFSLLSIILFCIQNPLVQVNVSSAAQPGALTKMLNWYRAMYRLKPGVDLSSIQVPVLVLWGARDTFMSVRLTEDLQDWVPNYRVILYENCTHWVPSEVRICFVASSFSWWCLGKFLFARLLLVGFFCNHDCFSFLFCFSMYFSRSSCPFFSFFAGWWWRFGWKIGT